MVMNKKTKGYGRSLPVVAGCKNEAKTKPFCAGKRAVGGQVEIANGLIIQGNTQFLEVSQPVAPGRGNYRTKPFGLADGCPRRSKSNFGATGQKEGSQLAGSENGAPSNRAEAVVRGLCQTGSTGRRSIHQYAGGPPVPPFSLRLDFGTARVS
jgi:hypothetical protein